VVVSARPARALTSGAARRRRDRAGRARSSFARGIALSFFEEFDLDDGPKTEEHPPATGRGRRGGLGGGGNGPDMRRILPVVGVVVLVLVLGFVVLGSCSGTSKADQYRSYVQDVNSVARQSNNDARALDAALYNQELTPNQVTTRVAGFIPRARAAETTAAALKPAGKIKQQELQRYLLQALQYRTLALQDLQAALRTALAGTPNTPATQAQRTAVANAYSELIASDVVYAASFQRPAQAILKAENVTDAPITPSVWALSPELANPAPTGNGLWIESVRDAGTSKPCESGAIGTSIDEVKANGKTLQPGTATGGPVTTVKLKIPSNFTVTVANHGSCPVRGVSVHLIEGSEKQQNFLIKSLLPNETVTVPFVATGNPGEAKVDVSVTPVTGESNTANNHYTYHVAFQS
jgi:outer membrane murein-binding lipoprotein Lpp